MFTVTYYENKHLILSVLTREAPVVGQDIKIKGRKGKVNDVHQVDDRNVHVNVTLEVINKQKVTADLSKKKKR